MASTLGWSKSWTNVVLHELARTGLVTLFTAWAWKFFLIVVLMGVVLTQYKAIVHAAFFLAFAITVGVFSAAIAVSDTEQTTRQPE